MKNIIIVIVITIMHLKVGAQASLFQGFSMDFSTGWYQSKSWNHWKAYYNSVNAGELKKDMSGFRPAVGFELGYNFCIAVRGIAWYSPIRYNYGRATATAKFKDGTARIMQLEKRTFYMPIGLGAFNVSGNGFGGVFFSIPVGMSVYRLNSAYEYRDGTVSYGGDKGLNGIYRGYDGKIGADISLMGGMGKLGVIMHATYMLSFLPPDVDAKVLSGASGSLNTNGGAVTGKFREFSTGIGIIVAL